MSKAKFYCFTENSNPNAFQARLEILFSSIQDEVSYICGQLETASTGQRHFQGYVQLRVARALSWVRTNISDTAHWEKQKGTNTQARDYCRKIDETTIADTFVEFGTFGVGRGGKGARNDITSFKDAIKNGATQRELADSEHLENFAKYIKLHDRLRSLYPTKRKSEEFKLILYVGDPGSGKTRKAKEENPGLFEVPITNGTLWFDGYDGHEVVLWDDFMGAGSKMSLDNTLKYFDRYVRQVPVKGAHVWYMPNTVIVTSNYHPRTWYSWKGREESWNALTRRFTEVWMFHLGDEPELQPSVEEYFNDHDQWPQFDVNGNYEIN